MSALIRLTPAQEEVIDWLRELPNPYLVKVTAEDTIYTDHIITDVRISGGTNIPDGMPCGMCGNKKYHENGSVTFIWKNGKFSRAEVWNGRRQRVKSITHAAAIIDRMVGR